MNKDFTTYENFTIPLFLEDEYFLQWVQMPDGESKAFWEGFQRQYPHKKEEVSEARQFILSLQFKEDLPSIDSYNRVWQNIVIATEESDRNSLRFEEATSTNYFRQWYRVAATVSVLLVVGALLFFYIRNFGSQEYQTTYGEVKNIVLPDGSHVKLNANSKLRFPARWSEDGNREVWLEGEAYFSVVHTQRNQRFLVHLTDSTQVEVLGTEFTVFQRKRGTRVVLTSGKVKFDIAQPSGKQELVLKPGEMVESMHESDTFTKKTIDPNNFSAWKDRKLVFNDIPLPEVISVLEENYGIRITVADTALLQKRVWGSAPMEDVDIVLAGLSRSFGWQFTRKGNKVLLKANSNGF